MSRSLGQEITELWRSESPSAAPLKIAGVRASAKAYALVDLLTHSDAKVLAVFGTTDEAQQTYSDVKTILKLLGRKDLASAIDFAPGWETSPYLSIEPSLRGRVLRLRALMRATAGGSRMVVAGVDAFLLRTPGALSLIDRSFSVRVGERIDRGDLLTKLNRAGYRESDPTEDVGTFSVRGHIVDIFSSASKFPFRVEFFDDEVESIRIYDPKTQRTQPDEPVKSAEIFPVSYFSGDATELARAKTQIKTFSDSNEYPKKNRDELFERLEAGSRDLAVDYLFPYFEAETSAFIDHFDQSWKLVLVDSLAVEAGIDTLERETKDGYLHALEEQRIAVPPEGLYSNFPRDKTRLVLDGIELGLPAEKTEETDESHTEVRAFFSDRRANLDVKTNEDLKGLEAATQKIVGWAKQDYVRAVVTATKSQAERIEYLLTQHDVVSRISDKLDLAERKITQLVIGDLSSGFRITNEKLAIVTDTEIFGPKKRVRQAASQTVDADAFIPSLEELNTGDLVVHQKHGVGRYKGLVKLSIDQVQQDFLLLEYAGGDKLYLPVYRLDSIQRYSGASEGSTAPIDKLGTSQFEKTKEKVKGELKEIAHELLELYAKRAMRSGFSYTTPDEDYRSFEAKFPYAETPDQLKAIDDVLDDMQSEKIMDRLVCGDVGYGKTEVAMRAAYKAVQDGKQVAVLVPTTVLALQHERSFRERFKELPVRIGGLSRFKTAAEVKQTVAELKEGKLDIVIGTHRLLSRDVEFKDLGVLIVDEEQRFGVEHKERLKRFKISTDVLTLTATPIPRTLHFSLMGLRDISVINTPPVDRLAVRTYVSRWDTEIIRNAITQEIARGGQVFFIHNRVQTIQHMAEQLKEIVPNARVTIAHGQLPEKELEERMLEFYNKKSDVLLCSTIIESGLDISSANTMIINRADTFGLAQLYQLRGRVGRSQLRAYCYLLLPEVGNVSDDAKERLDVIQRLVELGSGFKVASHDLELRGGGDMLGKNQSGQITAVGFELYLELMEEAVLELKGEEKETKFDPEIKLPVAALLPEDYVPDVHQRLGLYKRLSAAVDQDALVALETEIQDRFGPLPQEVTNLIGLIGMKQLLSRYRVKSLVVGKERLSLEAGDQHRLAPAKIAKEAQTNPRNVSVTPDSKIVLRLSFENVNSLTEKLTAFLTKVAES